MLHLISLTNIDAGLIARITTGDVLIFLDDAVYSCLRAGKAAEKLTQMSATSPCYVLAEHLELRGIQAKELFVGIHTIDFPAFVNLSIEHTPIYTWA